MTSKTPTCTLILQCGLLFCWSDVSLHILTRLLVKLLEKQPLSPLLMSFCPKKKKKEPPHPNIISDLRDITHILRRNQPEAVYYSLFVTGKTTCTLLVGNMRDRSYFFL